MKILNLEMINEFTQEHNRLIYPRIVNSPSI